MVPVAKNEVTLTNIFDGQKDDADGNADTAWNQAHTYSSKSIAITQQDVFRRAQFECTIEPI